MSHFAPVLPCVAWLFCRILGVAFAVPATYFAARGFINGPLGKRLGICFLMGGAQGLVGWWMVRSGLEVGVCTVAFSPVLCGRHHSRVLL